MNKISVFKAARDVFDDTKYFPENTEPERKLLEEKVAQRINRGIEELVGYLPIEIRPVFEVGKDPSSVDMVDIEIIPRSCTG